METLLPTPHRSPSSSTGLLASVGLSYVQTTILIAILTVAWLYITRARPVPGFPVLKPNKFAWLPSLGWFVSAREMLFRGQNINDGKFQVMTTNGPKIVLPNSYTADINHPHLTFAKTLSHDFPIDFPGWEGFKAVVKEGTFLQEVIRTKLTQSLNLVTDDIVDEVTCAVHDLLGDDPEWHVQDIKPALLDVAARMSSRIFLGKGLARSQEWLSIAKDYTTNTAIATMMITFFPAFTRPLVHWFLPHAYRSRQQVKRAQALITPEINRRVARVEAARAAGGKPPKVVDAIGWMHEVDNGRNMRDAHGFSYVGAQLGLSFAAIHTTAEGLTYACMDLAEHPEIVEPLRQEVIRVIGEDGWAKTSIYKLKLMDSFLKESQRMHVMMWNTMQRGAVEAVTLKDGTHIPKGSNVTISHTVLRDASIYPDPDRFLFDRFYKKRQEPGEENNHQLVSLSKDHMGFGYGRHACPGRFFAANELKIALAHLLLKYDIKLKHGETKAPESMVVMSSEISPMKAELMLRRRQEEICLDIDLREDDE